MAAAPCPGCSANARDAAAIAVAAAPVFSILRLVESIIGVLAEHYRGGAFTLSRGRASLRLRSDDADVSLDRHLSVQVGAQFLNISRFANATPAIRIALRQISIPQQRDLLRLRRGGRPAPERPWQQEERNPNGHEKRRIDTRWDCTHVSDPQRLNLAISSLLLS